MKETLNEDQSKTCNATYKEEEDPGETSSSLEAIVVTKPKQGFLDNELFSDDNMDISDDTLRNNINSIANLKEEDIEIYEIINDSSNSNKTDKKEDKDCSGNRDVNNSEVFNRSGKRDVNNSEESDVNSENPDAYRIDNTPGFLDCSWRIQNNVYPVDNRGFGCHKKMLDKMENTGNEREQELLQVLSDVTSTVSRQASEEDESRQDCEEDDEEGDSDNECETCGYNSRDYSDSGNDGDGTPTSEYESAKDEIMNKSHNSDTGDKSAVQKEEDKKECDIKDNDGGGKREDDEALQKHDLNATVPADQKECDVTEHEKRGVDKHVQNCDVNTTVECYITENDEPLQKHDVNATLPADKEERDVTQQPILITPQPHPTGHEQVIPSDLQLDNIVDLSGQMLIDAQTGQAHNIDNVDISQFNEVYLVNPSVDNPLQESQTVKIQLIEETVTLKEEQEKIDQKVVEQIEVNVNTQVGDIQMKDQDGKVNEDTTEQNKTKEIGENSVRKDDNMNPDESNHDVIGENEDSTNPDDASPDKKHDVTVTEEKDDTTNPDDARTDTKCDNDNDTKETGETNDVTNEKEGENDKESDVKEDTMHDTKCDVTESDDPEKNRDVTEDNQVKEKVNEGTEEQKDKENAKEENDTCESDIVVLAQYKEKKKNIEVIDLMTSSSDENKRDVIDEDAREEQKHDIIDEDAKESSYEDSSEMFL